jgi:hypothetical protein
MLVFVTDGTTVVFQDKEYSEGAKIKMTEEEAEPFLHAGHVRTEDQQKDYVRTQKEAAEFAAKQKDEAAKNESKK